MHDRSFVAEIANSVRTCELKFTLATGVVHVQTRVGGRIAILTYLAHFPPHHASQEDKEY
jgi:hypothetical protein